MQWSTANVAAWAGLVVAAYLLGSVPFGLLLTRLVKGTDVRLAGSGNIGATNVARVAGRSLGVVTLLLDTLKGIAPVGVAGGLGLPPPVLGMVGLAAVTGHCFSVFLRFKGGKGVATALGVYLATTPMAALCGMACYAVVFAWTRISSLGSLVLVGVTVLASAWWAASAWIVLAHAVIALLVMARHQQNIRRLLAGQEASFKS